MFRSILVPLDGSAYAEQALAPALWIARKTGAAVRLIHVRPPPETGYDGDRPVSESEEGESAVRSYLQQYLGVQARRIAERDAVHVSFELVDGQVAPGILGAADDSDLIVLTTHGHGGLAPAWLGSNAEGVIRQARIPVLQIRPRASRDVPDEPRFRRILVPLDGSGESETALGPARDLASVSGGELILLAVVTLPREVGDPPVTLGGSLDPAREYSRAEAYLGELESRIAVEGVRVRSLVQTSVHPAAAILGAVAGNEADIIVMATHGRSRLRRMSVGSVFDKVARATTVPILLVRPREVGRLETAMWQEAARA